MLLKLAVVSFLRVPGDPGHTLMIGFLSVRGVMHDGVVLGYCWPVRHVHFPLPASLGWFCCAKSAERIYHALRKLYVLMI